MPSLFVVVSIELPVGVVSSTVAPTSVAPDGSVTCPRITPVCACPQLGAAINSSRQSRNATPPQILLPSVLFCNVEFHPFWTRFILLYCAAASAPPLLKLHGVNMLRACSCV